MGGRKLNIFALVLLLLVCQSSVKAGKKRRKKITGCPFDCHCRRYEIDSDAIEANCRSKNLSEIPFDFGDQEYWMDVDLSLNNIALIDETSFNNIHRINTIKLSGNRISRVHPKSFKLLHALTDLGLERNEIEGIPPYLFSDSPNIKNLRLTSNLITNLTAESFTGLHNLEHLLLEQNLLTEIPIKALQQTPRLKFLILAANRITFIPDDAFASLKELIVLNLRENQILRMGKNALDTIPLCEELDLSYNRLTEYPATITRLEKLIQLAFKNNKIEHLPNRAFSRQIHLQTLTFHNNEFRSVGRWTFSRLFNLKSLLLLNVPEQYYFPEISACTKLKTLSVTGSRIVRLPENLCSKNSHLTNLNLRNNRLYNMSGLGMCSNLEFLDVSGNVLTRVSEEEMTNLTSLKDIDLSNNSIVTVGKNSFANIAGLEKLNLAFNPITSLPDKGLDKLNILNISSTRNLFYLPSKESLPNLHHLRATYPYHCCLLFSKENIKTLLDENERSVYSCSPIEGPLSPCSDLLEPEFARVFLWVVLTLTLFFNCFIVLLSNSRRIFSCTNYSKSKRVSQTASNSIRNRRQYVRVNDKKFVRFDFFELLLSHMCLADLIAALYVVIIVIYDAKSSGHFIEDAAWWQESMLCRAAGFCLVFGLQMGFYTLFIATLERYLATMYPLNPEKHFKKSVLALSLGATWILSVATGVVTLYNGDAQVTNDSSRLLPPYNGAMCLPWSTSFSYVAVLVAVHVATCCVMIILCALMYCKKQKQSWLSARKSTRTQISLLVLCNSLCLLPLSFLGLLASAIVTFSSAGKPWSVSEIDEEVNVNELNVKLMLIVALLFLCLRFLFNPFLYISFNKHFRSDFKQMFKAVVCLDKEKSSSGYFDYQNARRKNEVDTAEIFFPYLENQEQLPHVSSSFNVIQTLPYRVASHSSDFSEYPPTSESPDSRHYSSDEEEDSSLSLTSEQLLCCSTHRASLLNDTDDSSSSENTFQPVEVFPDILDDPFWETELLNAKSSEGGIQHLPLSDNQPQKSSVIENPNEDNTTATKTSNPSIAKTNSFSLYKSIRSNAINERKRRRIQMMSRQKEEQGALSTKSQMMSQSGESSTSKDSGIQSEPDLGVVAPSSSNSSSLSRCGNEMNNEVNVLPDFLVASPKKQGTSEKGTDRPDMLVQDEISYPLLPSARLEPATYYILRSTSGKALLKRETTL